MCMFRLVIAALFGAILFGMASALAAPGLMEASQGGDLARVRALIATRTNVNAVGPDGKTALIVAVTGGHAEIVQALVAAKANINATDKGGNTSLMYAADNGFLAIVGQLIEARANVTVKGFDGADALALAVRKGSLETAKVLIAAGAPVETLHVLLASRHMSDELTLTLLDAAKNPADKEKISRAAWFAAARKGQQAVISTLLARNSVDVNIQDPIGATALLYAAAYGQMGTVRTLVEHKANPDLSTQDGQTALAEALSHNHQEIILQLREVGAAEPPAPPAVSTAQKSCFDVQSKTSGMAILAGYSASGPKPRDIAYIFGNVKMSYYVNPLGNSMEPGGELIPGGPSFTFVVINTPTSLAAAFRGASLPVRSRDVFVWKTDGKKKFPRDAMKELEFLCHSDDLILLREWQELLMEPKAFTFSPPLYPLDDPNEVRPKGGLQLVVEPSSVTTTTKASSR